MFGKECKSNGNEEGASSSSLLYLLGSYYSNHGKAYQYTTYYSLVLLPCVKKVKDFDEQRTMALVKWSGVNECICLHLD
jgi:hypothetical protein